MIFLPFITTLNIELRSISSSRHWDQVPSQHIPLFPSVCVFVSGREQLLWLLYLNWVGSQLLSWHSHAHEQSWTSHMNACCSFLHYAEFGVPLQTPEVYSCLVTGLFSVSLFTLSLSLWFYSLAPLVYPCCSSNIASLFLATISEPCHPVQHAYKGWC